MTRWFLSVWKAFWTRHGFFPWERQTLRQRPRVTRSGHPLYRTPGFESLEPRIDVATFWFDSAASILHVTLGDESDWQGSSIGLGSY
jgi:hypothetical protein